MKQVFLLISIGLFFNSCFNSNKALRTENNNFVTEKVEFKHNLQDSIIMSWVRIPTFIFAYQAHDKNEKYNLEFDNFDNHVTRYRNLSLSAREKELLALAVSKRYFVASEYSLAIKELDKVLTDGEFGVEKRTLLAVIHDYGGQSEIAENIFTELLSNFEEVDENNYNCTHYYILKRISGSTEYSRCESFISLYKRNLTSKESLITNNILNAISL